MGAAGKEEVLWLNIETPDMHDIGVKVNMGTGCLINNYRQKERDIVWKF